jgi:hypothetical protein
MRRPRPRKPGQRDANKKGVASPSIYAAGTEQSPKDCGDEVDELPAHVRDLIDWLVDAERRKWLQNPR